MKRCTYRQGLLPFLVVAGLLLHTAYARADAIVTTQAMRANNIAEYFVEEEQVRVELEIAVADLAGFANLLPDSVHERLTGEQVLLAERLPRFFTQDFALVVSAAEEERLLEGFVQSIGPRERITRDPVTGEPIAVEGEEPEAVVFAELVYPFASRPDAVTLINRTGSSIGFVAYHQGVAVNDFRYLSPAQTLTLDWDDPWYSSFGQRSLTRTYFAPMSIFIYVEPYEVRKEIIVRPKDMQRWIDLGLEEQETIPVEAQAELQRRVGEFLRDRHATTIDGELVSGELARINFLERTLKTSNVIDPPRELDLNVATLGVIYVYPTVAPLPQNVTVEWDMFTEKMSVIPGASVDQAGALPVYLEPDFATLEWQNFLRFPELPTLTAIAEPPDPFSAMLARYRWAIILFMLAGLLWAGLQFRRAGPKRGVPVVLLTVAVSGTALYLGEQARMSAGKSQALVGDLLHNVYRAFDFRAEGDIYDVLEQSVAGDFLTTVYLETRRGLVLENQGGARAKVKDIELRELATRPSDAGGLIAEATWVVSGSVGHWGHLHERQNLYQAELDIRPVNGAWKLVGMEVLAEERL